MHAWTVQQDIPFDIPLMTYQENTVQMEGGVAIVAEGRKYLGTLITVTVRLEEIHGKYVRIARLARSKIWLLIILQVVKCAKLLAENILHRQAEQCVRIATLGMPSK